MKVKKLVKVILENNVPYTVYILDDNSDLSRSEKHQWTELINLYGERKVEYYVPRQNLIAIH